MTKSSESNLYKSLGASSSKEGVLNALKLDRPKHFIELSSDVSNDPNYFSFLHADGAGTKSIVAYLAFRETGDASWFKSLAFDSLIMNIDDICCVGPVEGLRLSNTIGRNRKLIPDSAIEAIISGYKDCALLLGNHGFPIELCGGETADVGDLVRTIIVDSTIFGRLKKSATISTDRIAKSDIIIGLSNSGQASYEDSPNSSISSNGFTLARHALIAKKYAQKYPEILDPSIDSKSAYLGTADLLSPLDSLNGKSLAQALLSPTRTYAPILNKIFQTVKIDSIHGIINCTGGGQTKILRFGRGVRFIKDSLFPFPPIFNMIQKQLNVPLREMLSVFNMGHRLEIIGSQEIFPAIQQICSTFAVEAKIVGRVEANSNRENSLEIHVDGQTVEY